MDSKSEWALTEFPQPSIELRLLDHSTSASENGSRRAGDHGRGGAQQAGSARTVSSTRIAYQGERLAGVLVVKFDAGSGEPWRTFCVNGALAL